jgi:hypothetical protein
MYATHVSFICPSPVGVLTFIVVSPHSLTWARTPLAYTQSKGPPLFVGIQLVPLVFVTWQFELGLSIHLVSRGGSTTPVAAAVYSTALT